MMTQRLLAFLFLYEALSFGQAVLTVPQTDFSACPPSGSGPSGVQGTGCYSQSAVSPDGRTSTLDQNGLPGGWDGYSAMAAQSSMPSASTMGSTTIAGKFSAPSSTLAGPPVSHSEFEIFAADAAGIPLQVYGRQLFNNVPTTFSPMDRVPVPANYVLGPGDELLIRAWGKIDLDSRVIVDRNGQIFVPKVGAVNVTGLRFEQIEGYLHSAIGNLYKDFELNVTMGQLRSIQIFVLGSAQEPGVYTVSSLSTLVNALFASGGPSATGTMRHIQLRRGSQIMTEFDIYDLLREGDKSHDVQLLPGDVIYIPMVGPQVAVMGSVNEPGIYELKGETTISSALKAAGGLTNLAEMDHVLLERITDHKRRSVDEFSLDTPGLQRPLADGDMLRVLSVSPKFDNAVTLRGSVAQPGRVPWNEGMRVSDLIRSRDSLITRHYWNQQNHMVGPGNQAAWGNQAASYLPGIQAGLGNQKTEISEGVTSSSRENGNQQNGSTADPNSNVVADLVENSAEINWDYAAIARLDEYDLSTHVIAFNLGKALADRASADNQVLKPGDVVTIFSRKDIPLSQDKHAAFVRIDGEVNAPGMYRINPGETLQDAVERAGGVSARAYLYASQLTRVSTRMAQERELAQTAVQMRRELMARFAAASSTIGGNAAQQQAQLNEEGAMLAQLSAVHPTGRIVLALSPTAGSAADIPKFALEDGDRFYVPPVVDTVFVSGSVYNEGAFRYQADKRLSEYLSDSGGPTRQADKGRIFLIRADGTIVSRQNHNRGWGANFGKTVLRPGDSIVVPTKLKMPGGWMQQLPLVTQVLSQSAVTGAVIGSTF